MVEMPGIREPERMRKLLQGSANLEFWETYNSQEITPYLAQLDQRLANGETKTEASDSTKTEAAGAKAEPSAKNAKLTLTANKKNAAPGEDAQAAAMKKMHPIILNVTDYPW